MGRCVCKVMGAYMNDNVAYSGNLSTAKPVQIFRMVMTLDVALFIAVEISSEFDATCVLPEDLRPIRLPNPRCLILSVMLTLYYPKFMSFDREFEVTGDETTVFYRVSA